MEYSDKQEKENMDWRGVCLVQLTPLIVGHKKKPWTPYFQIKFLTLLSH